MNPCKLCSCSVGCTWAKGEKPEDYCPLAKRFKLMEKVVEAARVVINGTHLIRPCNPYNGCPACNLHEAVAALEGDAKGQGDA